MQFQIEVIESNEVKNKKNARGGQFNAAEIAYKKDGKVEAKSFPDWANKEVYPSLLALKKGDIRVVTTEKVNGYWQWLSLGDPGTDGVSTQTGETSNTTSQEHGGNTQAAQSSARPVGRVIGNTYETPEEREIKQRAIIAQTSITSAISLFKQGAADVPSVLEAADNFYNWALDKAFPKEADSNEPARSE